MLTLVCRIYFIHFKAVFTEPKGSIPASSHLHAVDLTSSLDINFVYTHVNQNFVPCTQIWAVYLYDLL